MDRLMEAKCDFQLPGKRLFKQHLKIITKYNVQIFLQHTETTYLLNCLDICKKGIMRKTYLPQRS
jgi:hypothetical protein